MLANQPFALDGGRLKPGAQGNAALRVTPRMPSFHTKDDTAPERARRAVNRPVVLVRGGAPRNPMHRLAELARE